MQSPIVWASLMGTHGEDRKTKPREESNMWVQRIQPENTRTINSPSEVISANVCIYKSQAKRCGLDIKGQRVWPKPLRISPAMANNPARAEGRGKSCSDPICWLLASPGFYAAMELEASCLDPAAQVQGCDEKLHPC